MRLFDISSISLNGLWVFPAAVLLLLTAPAKATAAANPAEICDRAAQIVADEANVPLSVLRAITRTETGRTLSGELQPWAWTVNMEGTGVWFDTEDDARSYVFKHFKRGARSFDVGCFQINYKWHGHAFKSIDDMFDPIINARYAAKFLLELFNELGDWTKAVGAYHSRTDEFASRYVRRYEEIHANLGDVPAGQLSARALPSPRETSEPRQNSFPLLKSGAPPRMGSLVPLGTSGRGSLFGNRQQEG